MALALALAGAAIAGVETVTAAPPPPAPVPEALNSPVGGYDLRAPYQRWHIWVERQKGPAIDALFARPEEVEGYVRVGAPFLLFKKHLDLGHFLTGEIQAYCQPAARFGVKRETCHHRLRRIYVAHNPIAYGQDNPVARWTRESFDAAKLAAHFRASGIAPASDWWRLDAEKMFAGLPSPVPMLMDNASIVRLDSRTCPPMAQAIAELDGKQLDWRLDIAGVGEDGSFEPSGPHAVETDYTLSISTPGGGRATIEGSGGGLTALISPIIAATNACEKGGRATLTPALPRG